MNSSSYPLEQLHSKLLTMYKELKELFDNNNIRYYGIAGTAIGALRESGFIKWDDDIDLAVLEEDIPKLAKALEGSKYSLINNRLKFNPYPFYKIYDNSQLVSERGEILPLNIDIFIATKKRAWDKSLWRKQEYYKFILYSKSRKLRNFDWKTSKGRFIGFWIMGRLLFMFSAKRNSTKLMSLMPSVQYDESSNDKLMYCYHKFQGEVFDISTVKEYKFEDTTIKVSESFPKDMAWRYGDVMKKPTKEYIYNHSVYLYEKSKNR